MNYTFRLFAGTMKSALKKIVGILILGVVGIVAFFLVRQTSSVRWRVKTLTDRDVVLVNFDSVVPTTVREQASLKAEAVSHNTSRLPTEHTVYRLTGDLIALKQEYDGDYHLVIQDTTGSATMIAEIPKPIESHTPKIREAFRYYRHFIDSIAGKPRMFIHRTRHPIRLELTGVGFFDEPHAIAQTGMAPNNRELHPVLSIRAVGETTLPSAHSYSKIFRRR